MIDARTTHRLGASPPHSSLGSSSAHSASMWARCLLRLVRHETQPLPRAKSGDEVNSLVGDIECNRHAWLFRLFHEAIGAGSGRTHRLANVRVVCGWRWCWGPHLSASVYLAVGSVHVDDPRNERRRGDDYVFQVRSENGRRSRACERRNRVGHFSGFHRHGCSVASRAGQYVVH